MNLNHEKVNDILREIRGDINDYGSYPEPNMWRRPMREYCNRIEEAYHYEMEHIAAPTPDQWTEIAQQMSKLYDLEQENKLLHRALECIERCSILTHPMKVPDYAACYDAVKKAQEILKGVTK